VAGGPTEPDAFQAACPIPEAGLRGNGPGIIVLGVAHPCHAVSAKLHGNTAKVCQELLFVGGSQEYLIASAEHVQGTVAAGQLQLVLPVPGYLVVNRHCCCVLAW